MDQNYMAGRTNCRQPYPGYTRERTRPQNPRPCIEPRFLSEPYPRTNFRETPLKTHENTACSCSPAADSWKNMPVGMAYVPWQEFGSPMDISKGFCKGTIFPCLDYPFYVGGCPK